MQSLLPDIEKDMRQVTAVLDLEKIAGDKEKERHMVGVVGIQAAKGEMLCPVMAEDDKQNTNTGQQSERHVDG